jgi:hypothetical protein
MSERCTVDAWKEIVEEILPRACARQAGECGRAIALAARCGFSSGAVAKVIDDARREYDGLVMAQQKLAELLAGGDLARSGPPYDTTAIRNAMQSLKPP